MADPLGLAGSFSRSNNGVGGLHDLLRQSQQNNPPAGPAGDGPSFKDVLLQSMNEVNNLEQQASHAQEDLASGARTDVENVILATQKADTAFRALLAVRNKVQAAYEELKQTRI